MGAALLKNEMLAITPDEADKLAKAIADVSQHYDVPLMDEKSAAWMKLAMVGGSIYGTRVMTMVMAQKSKPQLVSKPISMTTPYSPPVSVPHA